MMTQLFQKSLEKLNIELPDIVCLAIANQQNSDLLLFHVFSETNFKTDHLKEFVKLELAQIKPHYKNQFIQYEGGLLELVLCQDHFSYLFFSGTNTTNMAIIQAACKRFVEDFQAHIHSLGEQNSAVADTESGKNTPKTSAQKEKKSKAVPKKDAPKQKETSKQKEPPKQKEASVSVEVLREQEHIQVQRQTQGATVQLVHFIHQPFINPNLKPAHLEERRFLLKNLKTDLVLSQIEFQEKNVKATRSFINGNSLADIINKNKGIQVKAAMAIFQKLLYQLQPLYQVGLAHGNIHPHNIVISDQRKIVLTDDGLFDLVASDNFIRKSYSNVSRIPIGHLGFIAPEQLLGKQATPQSDFWALGFLLAYMILGEPVCHFKTPSEQIVAAHFSIKEVIKDKLTQKYEFLSDLFSQLIQEKESSRFEKIEEVLDVSKQIIKKVGSV